MNRLTAETGCRVFHEDRPLTSARLLFILVGWILTSAVTSSAGAIQSHYEAPIELSGMSISEAYQIKDDQPLDVESPTVKKLLHRVKKTSPRSRKKYGDLAKAITWDEIVEKTEDHRLWVFDRMARLRKIEQHRFADTYEDAEIKGLFVCHCVNDQGQPFVALARTIPRALKPDVTLDEPVRVEGFLYARATLTLNGIDSDEPIPVFVIDRLAWFPDQLSENVPASHLELAAHGVDIGLLDFVRDSNTRPLGSRDAEAFYRFLAGVGRMNPTLELNSELGFEDLVQNPNSNFGERVRMRGVVRTCTAVPQADDDIRDRLGISRHYQLMLFPDLDGATIIVKNQNGKQLDYRRFPVTVCCRELPAAMSPADIERRAFVVEGFFFRFWKYQSEKTDEAGASGQISPLVIANRLIPVDVQSDRMDSILLIFVLAVIGGFAALVYGFRIADKKRKPAGEKILASLPDRIDLSGIDD